MTHRKKSCRKKSVGNGFRKHAQLERLVMSEIAHRETLRKTACDDDEFLREKRDRNPNFIENIGAVSIYSIGDLEKLYRNARQMYGDERERYARNLLAEAAKLGNRRNLAGPPADDLIEGLRQDFPNFAEAIDHIEFAAALSKRSKHDWFQMPPLLLLGPPGVGKTAFAQAFAEIIGVNFRRLDVGTMSTASIIAGLSLGWGSGHPGEMFKLMTSSSTANPLLMLDEVDKIGGHDSTPIEPTLLSLLEGESAGAFQDEALLLRLNCRHVLWIATANDSARMSDPLMSRFTVVHVRAPTREEAPKIIRSIYRSIRLANPWGTSFKECPSEEVIERLIGHRPREISSLLHIGFGKAAKRGCDEVHFADIPPSLDTNKSRIGFI